MTKEGVVDIFFSDAAKDKEVLYGVRSAFIGAGFVAGVTRSADGYHAAIATDGTTLRAAFPRSARVFICVPLSASGEFFSTVLSDAKEGTFIRDQLQTVIAHNEPRESSANVPLALYIYEKLFSGKIRWWCFEFVEGDVKQMFTLLQGALAALPSQLHPDYLERLEKVFFRYREGEWRLMDIATDAPPRTVREEPVPASKKAAKKIHTALNDPDAIDAEATAIAAETKVPDLSTFIRSIFPRGEGLIALVNPLRDIRLLYRCAGACIRDSRFPTGFAALGITFAKWLVIFFVFQTTFAIF